MGIHLLNPGKYLIWNRRKEIITGTVFYDGVGGPVRQQLGLGPGCRAAAPSMIQVVGGWKTW